MKIKLLKSKLLLFVQTGVLAGLIYLTILPAQQVNKAQAFGNDSKIYYQTAVLGMHLKLDKRTIILKKYLAKYNSPIQGNAADFIDAADKYGLDWKLLPSIAGVESTFGKQIPGGFNAWGWGVYGDQAIYFDSWRDGIFTISEGLRTRYLDKGLNDPYAINRVYAASPSWGSHVTYFMNDLTKFAAENYYNDDLPNKRIEVGDNVAGSSGQIQDELKLLAFNN